MFCSVLIRTYVFIHCIHCIKCLGLGLGLEDRCLGLGLPCNALLIWVIGHFGPNLLGPKCLNNFGRSEVSIGHRSVRTLWS